MLPFTEISPGIAMCKANSGFYLVYNEVDERAVGGLPTGRQFILKYSHIFDALD